MTDGLRIKLDENLGRTHVELLHKAGYDAERVTDENLSGAMDEDVWKQACAENRLLITLDLDFSDIRRWTAPHPGVVLLRPRSRSRGAVAAILQRLIDESTLEGFRGHLAVADETRTRLRRPVDPDESV